MARSGVRHRRFVLWLALAGGAMGCATDEGREGSGFSTTPTSVGATTPVGSTGDSDGTGGPDEESSSGAADPDSSTSTGADPSSTTTTTSTSTSTSTTSPPTSGDPVLDACLEMAVDACQMCGCNMCLDVLLACQQDPGCIAIRVCAENSGCTDDASCYQACQQVIEANGGLLGDSIDLAVNLAECIDSSCQICFQ